MDTTKINKRETMPNWVFHLMTFLMKVRDVFGYTRNNFKTLEIKNGQTVIDYGCGPARYVHLVSEAIGTNGKLYATDIHQLAVDKVKEVIQTRKLNNVEAVLSHSYTCPLPMHTADIILALDMFHMIEDTDALQGEFARLLKSEGTVIIEDGHQSRKSTIKKIKQAGIFNIVQENIKHVRCQKMNP
ncbi:MAG: class I SAM-dependent methyltransferase [Carboxylicivirga sp.]|jgi:ubiquinone/menaquinone biosynthesis C-methylase UbiE|nr:class I SAM-dependent methyltransferase [Carboxylicivirga sp.]